MCKFDVLRADTNKTTGNHNHKRSQLQPIIIVPSTKKSPQQHAPIMTDHGVPVPNYVVRSTTW